MEYVFYLVIFIAFVYVMTGVVQSTLLSTTSIRRDQLPSVVEKEFQQLFPSFTTQAITLQKARYRYHLKGKYGGKPGQLTFGLTPESELSVLEFSQVADDKRFVKVKPIPNSQIPPKIADKLQPYMANDQTLPQSSQASTGLIGDQAAYRIEVDSRKFHYQFDITDSGELFKFCRREVA